MYRNATMDAGAGLEAAKAPEVPTGTQEITANVTIVYQLK
jgi:hypothetical protein